MGIRGTKTWDDIQSWFASAGTVSAGSYTSTAAWTFGPTSPTAAVTQSVNGNLRASSRGIEAVYLGNSATDYSVISYNAQPTTTGAQYSRPTTGPVSILQFQNGGFDFYGLVSAGPGNFSIAATNKIGGVTQPGAWTLGPGAGTPAVGLTHLFQSNGSLVTRLRAATGNESELAFDINDVVQYKWSLTSTTLRLLNSASTIIGSINQTGIWALGNSTAVGTHSMHINDATSAVLSLRNFEATTASDASQALTIIKGSTTNGTTQNFIVFTINAGGTNSGRIAANGANTAAFQTFSDSRLKENIVDLPSQLDNIMALRPVEFDYIGYAPGQGHQLGFIAQEMALIYPDTVSLDPVEDRYTVTGWSKTEARLVKALQELKEQFDDYVASHP